MGILAAEVGEVAVVGLEELQLDLWILVRDDARHHQVDVDTLAVHVADACVGVPVGAARRREHLPHEVLELALCTLARTGLAEDSVLVSTPAGAAAAEAEEMSIRRVQLFAGPPRLEG